jgi:hypothetical protein
MGAASVSVRETNSLYRVCSAMVQHDAEEEPRPTESADADSVAEGIELTRRILRALPPEDDEDRAYRNSVEATLTSVESLSEISGDGGERSPAEPLPLRIAEPWNRPASTGGAVKRGLHTVSKKRKRSFSTSALMTASAVRASRTPPMTVLRRWTGEPSARRPTNTRRCQTPGRTCRTPGSFAVAGGL